MARAIHVFRTPDRFVAGTVGQPGNRTFYLQAVHDKRVISVVLEKQQVAVLAERIAALLLEINRRFGPSTFRGGTIGVDLCAALYAALNGVPSESGSDLRDGDEFVRVNFPQEWLRDPESAWLRDYPADVPWDEPELIEALVAMRHES